MPSAIQSSRDKPGRYHLFLAWTVLGLQNSISLDVAFPNRTGDADPAGANLWEFSPGRIASLTGETLPECTVETGTGLSLRLARDICQREGSHEQSLPILYDKQGGRIVSNESAEIIRMLDAHATALGSTKADRPTLVPETPALTDLVTDLNARIYTTINNGAYKAGLSSDQTVYAAAFSAYFDTLDYLEGLLADGRPLLTGYRFTEVDLRLFPTLYRHDHVQYVRMKLNGASILNYPHLWRWMCRVHTLKGAKTAGSLAHCRQGYFGRSWNGVVPVGPIFAMTCSEAYDHPELSPLR